RRTGGRGRITGLPGELDLHVPGVGVGGELAHGPDAGAVGIGGRPRIVAPAVEALVVDPLVVPRTRGDEVRRAVGADRADTLIRYPDDPRGGEQVVGRGGTDLVGDHCHVAVGTDANLRI